MSVIWISYVKCCRVQRRRYFSWQCHELGTRVYFRGVRAWVCGCACVNCEGVRVWVVWQIRQCLAVHRNNLPLETGSLFAHTQHQHLVASVIALVSRQLLASVATSAAAICMPAAVNRACCHQSPDLLRSASPLSISSTITPFPCIIWEKSNSLLGQAGG